MATRREIGEKSLQVNPGNGVLTEPKSESLFESDLPHDLLTYVNQMVHFNPLAKFIAKYGKYWQACELPTYIPRGTPKECFSNCQKMVSDNGGTYCEGYAIHGETGFPVMHAWLVEDGKVIDPTWSHPELAVYFGVCFKRKYIFTNVVRTKHYVSLIDNYLAHHDLVRGEVEESIWKL